MKGKSGSADPRQKLLDTATGLFYFHGIRAIGVDRLLQESGVAKATLYRHFRGKDELVVAFIERRDAEWRAWLARRVEELAPDPADRPLAVFDALRERFALTDYRGCAFSNTIAEFPDSAHPAHRAAARHKHEVGQYLAKLLDVAGVAQADDMARALLLLIDGAIAAAVRERSTRPASDAQRVAALLIASPHEF